jgi:pyridoxal phosphate-dependent aminotransferase EpsN
MDYGARVAHDLVEQGRVKNRAYDKLGVDTEEVLLGAGGKVVEHDDFVPSLRERSAQVGADEARAPRYQHSHNVEVYLRLVDRLFLSPPDVGETERALLVEAFDSNWIAPTGPHVDAFEREFAARVGVQAAVALSSGTAALHLALLMLGVGRGDEVIVPTLTFVATANAVCYLGARPVFLDADAKTWNVDPTLVDDELTERARSDRMPAALVGVDLYGQCADWDAIGASCSRHGVPVVEDAAEALGATYRGRAAGGFGTLGAFSFNGNKVITTSGGGMLVSDDVALVDHARKLASHARDPAPHYEHSELGFNYRMSNLLAALGRGQLRHLDAKVARRRAIKRRYCDALEAVPGIAFMPDAPSGEPNNWLTVLTVDEAEFGAGPDDVRIHLETLDIEARPAWKPMHLQPLFAACPRRGGAVAEEIFRTGLCLPSGSSMTDADVDRVVDGVLATSRRPHSDPG